MIDTNRQARDYSRTASALIKTIAEPLFQILPVTTFGYRKFFDDGSYISLSNDDSWQEYYFSNVTSPGKTFGKAIHGANAEGLTQFLWPQKPREEIFQALYEHNIWHGITLYLRGLNYVESFAFGLPRTASDQSSLADSYNIEILKEFIFYFKDRGEDIVNRPDRSIRGQFKMVPYREDVCPVKSTLLRDQFLRNLQLDRIPLFESHLTFTPREWEVCALISSGRSIKSIAAQLNISSRTVESHWANIKSKTGFSSKRDLLKFFKIHRIG